MEKFKDVGKGKQDRSSEARQQGKDTTLDLIWRTKSGGDGVGYHSGKPSYFVEMQISRSVQRGESSMGKTKQKTIH